jgi:hypothetical protein
MADALLEMRKAAQRMVRMVRSALVAPPANAIGTS